MYAITFYLFVSYFILRYLRPTSNRHIFKGIAVALGIISLFYIPYAVSNVLYLAYDNDSTHRRPISYFLGVETSKFVFLIIITAVISFFTLRLKMRKEKSWAFTITHLSFAILFLVLGTVVNAAEISNVNSIRADLGSEVNEKGNPLDTVKAAVRLSKANTPIDVGDGIIVYDFQLNESERVMTTYYQHTLTDVSQYSREHISQMQKEWKKEMLAIAKASTKNKYFKDAGISLAFKMADKNRKEMLSVLIGVEEYR